MANENFTHIHLHTEYSLLDGLTNIKKLFAKVKELGQTSVAITDHGAMYGAIEFYKQGQKDGIKPILGMEAYTTPVDHTRKEGKEERSIHHLLLLAKNETGYKNLMKLSSIGWVEGYYYRPRIDRPTLAKYSEGLICTSACPAGELAQYFIDGNYDEARKLASWFLDVFGDNYYLEVQRHEYDKYVDGARIPEIKSELLKMSRYEKLINEGVVKLSRDLGIPIVATNDAHYLNAEDATAQDVLVCVATGKQVDDVQRIRFIDCPNYYVKTTEEMENLFPDLPEAITNTSKLAERCELTISTFGKWFFPIFNTPDGSTEADYLRKIAFERFAVKYPTQPEYARERLEYELGIIIQKGYAPYFLIVMNMVNWANSAGVITNTRGSAAGSFVSFILGITTVDPLVYYLPFERFLNPYRPTPPDIDFDVSDVRRDDVISYIAQTYGKDNVAQICTFGRMLARAAARDVARALGYEYAVGDKISKLIPPPKQGFPIDIPKALNTSPELKALYDTDQDAKKILDIAHRVEGSARHLSMHAAGVVVAPRVITDFTPIQKEKEGKIITQYEMHACEDVGLIKFDILGIRNLSILGSARDLVESNRKIKVDLHELPLDDKKTYDMLSRGETMGVFQLSGGGMTKYLMDLKPNKVEDLMAMVALYRPGPMAVIPEYIERKNNPSLIKYLDPRMEKFLKASYGLIVYQDDLLFCAIDLAGYSWEEADKFRKAVGKKIPEEMAAQKDKFVKGIEANGQTHEFAETLWKLFEPFQSYGFNKAHAASYGIVAYQTAYLKANYPVEYMTALMSAEAGDIEKISAAISECQRMGITVKRPDINESVLGFNIEKDSESLDGQAIRFGFSAIKNVGGAAIEAILEAREDGKFTSLIDFLQRVDGRRANKKVLESLIKSGCLDVFGNRASLLSAIDEVKSKIKPSSAPTNQSSLFFEEDEVVIGEGAADGADVEITHTYTDKPEFPESVLIAYERELMGFSLSAPAVGMLVAEVTPYRTHSVSDIVEHEQLPNGPVKLAGVLLELRVVVTKKTAAEMAFAKLSDGTGVIDVVFFPKLYAQIKTWLAEQEPVLLTGKLDSRDDKANMLVDTVETPSMLSGTEGRLNIKVPKNTETEKLQQLKQLLSESRGDKEVYLLFEGTRDEVKVPFGVMWNADLSRNVNKILYN